VKPTITLVRNRVRMGNAVSLVRAQSSGKEMGSSISEALDLIDFELNTTVDSVAIKPNLCYYWDAYTGYTTDPRIVAGIIDYIRESYGADVDIKVVEADATAMRTRYAFKMLGYEKLAKEKRVELFNLSRDKVEERKVNVNGCEIKLKVPCLLMESDLFINVPKLKVMRETLITCAMKNLFGCIASPRKVVYHPFLNEAIVGINKILRPDLTVVDGLVALGRFPVKLDLVVASIDPFSVDWIVSQIVGCDPSKIKFLKIAMKEKLGNPDGIVTCGEKVAVFNEIFPKDNSIFARWSWNTQLRLLKLYHKIVGDVVPPSLEGI